MNPHELSKIVALHVSKLQASDATLAFHHDSLVFDCPALYYLLDEPYAEWVLQAVANAANVTISSEGLFHHARRTY